MTCKLARDGAFLHVPKTGGSWVRAVLERNGLAGSSLGPEHTNRHSEKWAFCVFREPLAWWMSLWRFRNDTNFPPLDGAHPLYPLDSMHETDLLLFLARAIDEFPGFCGSLFARYQWEADYVLALENLERHMALLANHVGWPVLDMNIPPANTSLPRQLPPKIKEVSKRLNEVEHDAILMWRSAVLGWI